MRDTTGSIAADGMAGDGNLILDWNTLLGAVVGALLVFLFTEVREYLQRRRERTGLLTLLLAEIDYNYKRLDEYDVTAGLDFGHLTRQPIPVAQEAWIECRTKIAQLVDSRTFSDLENYYRICQELQDIRVTSAFPPGIEQTRKEAGDKIKELQSQADVVRKGIQKYIRDLPERFQSQP